MSGHTPTPWALFNLNGVLEIHDSDDLNHAKSVVHWTGFDAAQGDFSERQANAALIVKAVNAHDALVNALELFQSFGCPRCNGDCSSANPPVSACPMQDAQRALSLARSEGGRG